jgi:hypothetical protein
MLADYVAHQARHHQFIESYQIGDGDRKFQKTPDDRHREEGLIPICIELKNPLIAVSPVSSQHPVQTLLRRNNSHQRIDIITEHARRGKGSEGHKRMAFHISEPSVKHTPHVLHCQRNLMRPCD